MVLNFASRIFGRINAGTKKSKCLSHHFMVENGMIHQMNRGLYALMPLGERCVVKLACVVEARLHDMGAQRVALPRLDERLAGALSERWLTGSEIFRLSDRDGIEFFLQPTAEAAITRLVRDAINIPRSDSFPILLYQCNEKFRDESFPKFGLLRSRQFLMNDLYSFDPDERSAQITYKLVTDLYKRIFTEDLGLKSVVHVNANPGNIGGNVSHEFHMPNPSSGDQIRVCSKCGYASRASELQNSSKIEHTSTIKNQTLASDSNPQLKASCCNEHEFTTHDTVEIAHTFQLGTEYSEPLKAIQPNGDPYWMCCFGIGITRLLAACIDELSVAESAMRLPYTISPFKVVFILPKDGEKDPRWRFTWDTIIELEKMANLTDEIFVDDRLERSIGRRIVDANRLGIPHVFVSNSLKTDNVTASPTFEYFRSIECENSLRNEGRISHAELFRLAASM